MVPVHWGSYPSTAPMIASEWLGICAEGEQHGMGVSHPALLARTLGVRSLRSEVRLRACEESNRENSGCGFRPGHEDTEPDNRRRKQTGRFLHPIGRAHLSSKMEGMPRQVERPHGISNMPKNLQPHVWKRAGKGAPLSVSCRKEMAA